MGIFSGLFRSRDKPQNRTTGSTYSFFFGSSSAGKRVNERSAMQMTAVYSCVRILAEAVRDCRSTFTAIRRMAARKRPSTIRCICFCTMSQTRR